VPEKRVHNPNFSSLKFCGQLMRDRYAKKQGSTMTFCIENQEIGDILLVKNKAIKSKLNVVLQFFGTFKKSEHSHALLALSQGTFIEAMSYDKSVQRFGVDVVCIKELLARFSDDYEGNWKVLRFKFLTDSQRDGIENRSAYYFGQIYNRNILIRGVGGKSYKSSSYCSELIARIYEDIGISMKKRDIWPTHLNSLEKNNPENWIDVTNLYNLHESDCITNNLQDSLCNHYRRTRYLMLQANLSFREICNTSEELHESGKIEELYEYFIGEKSFYDLFVSSFFKHENQEDITPPKSDESWVKSDIELKKRDCDESIAASVKIIEAIIMYYEKSFRLITPYMESIVKCFKEDNKYYELPSSIAIEINDKVTLFSNEDLFDSLMKIDLIVDSYEEKFLVKTKLRGLLWLAYFLGEFKRITFGISHTQESCKNIIDEIVELPTFDDFLIEHSNKKSA
jgi:hypothetical protein